MAYQFRKGLSYRMPTHFGSSPGPRHYPVELAQQFIPSSETFIFQFLTSAESLRQLLPEKFELFGDPIVNVEFRYWKNLKWLAGRGYNTCGINFISTYQGKTQTVIGKFISVLFENRPEPIISGREELGMPKLFCDLPTPVFKDDSISVRAKWEDFAFLEASIDSYTEIHKSQLPNNPEIQGSLHLKYIPATPLHNMPDASYVTLAPRASLQGIQVKKAFKGNGFVRFTKGSWFDLPTLFNVVDVFYALPNLKFLSAFYVLAEGEPDFGLIQRVD